MSSHAPRRILVPLDGSDLALKAVPWATRLARGGVSQLVLLYARVPLIASARHPEAALLERANAREAQHRAFCQMQAVSDAVREQGVAVAVSLQRGTPATAILDTARRRAVDLVVMASHGEGGATRLVFGSVADAVSRAATMPLLIVPARIEPAVPAEGPLRVLVALDGSALAERALQKVSNWAAAAPFDLLLLRVVRSADERRAAELYLSQVAGCTTATCRTRVEVGHPAVVIERVAEQEQTDIIAVGSRGRGGLARLLLGSVATDVLGKTVRPVLLCRCAPPPST
jgi:nucleotide-binding universal stress UspA family protein